MAPPLTREQRLRALGDAVRHLRRAGGWSQEAFARHASIDRTYVGHVEQGRRNPSFTMLAALAEGLGVTLADLAAEVERRYPRRR